MLLRVVRTAPLVFLAWSILWHLLFASQVQMSYAFYPADLLLPPVTSFRTAISMLLLLLAGVITLCYLRKALRNTARVPDPQSHPIYEVGGPVAVPSFDFAAAVHTLEACSVAGRATAAKALDSIRISIPDRALPDCVADPAIDNLFASADRRYGLNPA